MADKQIENAIFNTITEIANIQEKEEVQNRVNKILEKIEQLEKIFDTKGTIWGKDNTYLNQSSYYNSSKGWVEELYKTKNNNQLPKALKIILEIFDLIRPEPLMLDVYKTERDDKGNVVSIKHYQKQESELKLKRNKKQRIIEYDLQDLIKNAEKIEEMNQAYLKHYQTFEKVAKSHYQRHSNDKATRYNFNEGHIIEAYNRHVKWNNDDEHFSDGLVRSPKHVAIMLYYSMNSKGWWEGGDIGFSQIKANNVRLASEASIKQISNKLIQMKNNPDLFTPEEFKKMFTYDEKEELCDYQTLARKTLKQSVQENIQLAKLTGINVTIDAK